MARPLFSHPLTLTGPIGVPPYSIGDLGKALTVTTGGLQNGPMLTWTALGFGARAAWAWAASPPANPAALPIGALAANQAFLTAALILYVNVKDTDGTDYTPIFGVVRGGGGQGQSDVLVVTNATFVARYKATGDAVPLTPTVYQFPVSLVLSKGTEPNVGDNLYFYIGLAAVA